MRYYELSIEGESQGTVETVPTDMLVEMLDYICRGFPVRFTCDDRCTIGDVEEQIRIELDIRERELR